MTKDEFDKLNNGDTVWFEAHYFHFPMIGIIRTIDGEKGVWINFFGDAQAHFIPRVPSFYDSVTPYIKDAAPKSKHETETIFAHTPHKAEPGYVFVEREFEDPDGAKDTWWERILESEVKEDDTVIKCSITTCIEPAVQLDHCHPYEILHTRCKKHLRTHIDMKCYDRFGILSACSNEHHDMQELRDSLDMRIRHLLDKCDTDSHSLMVILAETYRKVCEYINKKYAHELLSCQK